jgi:hypothetical protein
MVCEKETYDLCIGFEYSNELISIANREIFQDDVATPVLCSWKSALEALELSIVKACF